MVGYTNAELDGMKTYIEYLSQRPKRRGRRTAYHRDDMPDAWRECLQVNAHDQYALGLFTFYVYVVAMWSNYSR